MNAIVSADLASRYSAAAMGAISDAQARDIYLLSAALLTAAQNANHAALVAMTEIMNNKNNDGAAENIEFMKRHLTVIKQSLVAIGGVINGKQEG